MLTELDVLESTKVLVQHSWIQHQAIDTEDGGVCVMGGLILSSTSPLDVTTLLNRPVGWNQDHIAFKAAERIAEILLSMPENEWYHKTTNLNEIVVQPNYALSVGLIPAWQDADVRTLEEVLAVLDQAISECKAEMDTHTLVAA